MKRTDPSEVLFIGPSPDDPDPGLALRGSMQIETKGRQLTVTCPYCGTVSRSRLRPGTVQVIRIEHEPWCPVPTDEELMRVRGDDET